jgi:hypothetical protein
MWKEWVVTSIQVFFQPLLAGKGTIHEKLQTLCLVFGRRFKTRDLIRSRDISVCVTGKPNEEMLNLNG